MVLARIWQKKGYDLFYYRKNRLHRLLGFMMTIMLLIINTALAQSSSNALIEKFMKDIPADLQDQLITPAAKDSVQRLVSQKQAQERGQVAGIDQVASTIDESDFHGKETPKPSVYEKLFRSEQIYPDSAAGSLQVFGQKVFSGKVSSESLLSTAVPASYPIGPGDEIRIVLWGRINENYRLVVDRNGSINIPRIGPVTVSGLPFSALEKNLVDRLQTIEGVQANVSMGRLRSIPVYVVGEVRAPGQYTVSALASVTGVLFAAGGPKPMGSLRSVELRRGGKLVRKIDFYDFLLKGKNDPNLRLQPDDVILVPVVSQMIAVAGNVRRNGIFELKGKSTLHDAIELAGGISPGGWINRIQIERTVDNQYQTALDIKADSPQKIPAFELLDGDFVKVFPVDTKDERVVFLEGNVKQPGKYAFADGMRISDILKTPQDLLPESYFTYAVVQRHEPPDYLARIIPFDLASVLNDPNGPADLTLESRDRIIVYHRDFFEPDRSVSVDGSITTPGKYKLLDNMRVRDLILQAGGLRENASPTRGELYRRTSDGEEVNTEKIDFVVSSAMSNDPSQNLLLQKFDRVYVRRKRGWENEQTIELNGEFVYPGTYVLFEGETLDQLIERAGGFTADAYLDAAILTRPSVKKLEKERILEYAHQLERDMAQTTALMATSENKSQNILLVLEQQKKIREELKEIEPVGRVVIDLTSRTNYRDFLLENGDVLYVPKNTNTVSVIGEVYNPATFNYDASNPKVSIFLQHTGGAKREADKRNIYVIKANGSVVAGNSRKIMRSSVMPGDVIVVPQKISIGNHYFAFTRTLDTIEKLINISAATSNTILNWTLIKQNGN